MSVVTRIIKSCSVRLNGEIKNLKAGETITLPPEKSQRMVAAGYAEVIKPDAEEYRRLCRELAELDPKAGCWDWIIQNKSELWQSFMEAFGSGELSAARECFDEMVTTWNSQTPSARN